MRNRIKPATAALLAVSLASCATVQLPPVTRLAEGRDGYPKARIPFAAGQLDTDFPRESVMELVMEPGGSLALDGAPTAKRGLPAALERASNGGRVNAILLADPDMPFADVLPVLSRVEHAPAIRLLPAGFAPLRSFGQRERNGELPGEGETFRGNTEAYELPVWVSFDDDTGHCISTLGGMMLDSKGLYDRSFQILDNWVQAAGGADAFVADASFSSLRATIQAPPATPWKCLAGAGFAVASSGFQIIQYEIVAQ